MTRWHEASRCHSRYYAAKLITISDLCARGGDRFTRSMQMFAAEWKNIKRGQTCAEANRTCDLKAEALCADYADAGTHILGLRQHAREHIKWCEVGLAAAERLRVAGQEITILTSLGVAHGTLGEQRSAMSCHERALAIYREKGDGQNEGLTLANIRLALGRLDDRPGPADCDDATLALLGRLRCLVRLRPDDVV